MRASPTVPVQSRSQGGFTLVELMVTVAIALFLLGGLVYVVQTVRSTYSNQQALVQLQDQQRFALTLLTDVIQSGGYYDDPVTDTAVSALPPDAANGFVSGQAFAGTQGAAAPAPGDTISVRFRTAQRDGIINCTGGQNTAFSPNHVYTNTFRVLNSQLWCSLDGAAPVALVSGVVNLQVYYGVKRLVPATDYNVDTYAQANAMQPGDWSTVGSVRLIVTFANPLYRAPNQSVQQPQYVTFERVIQVMARAGDYT